MFIFKTLSEMERQTKEAGKEPPGVLMEALVNQHHMLIGIIGMDPKDYIHTCSYDLQVSIY